MRNSSRKSPIKLDAWSIVICLKLNKKHAFFCLLLTNYCNFAIFRSRFCCLTMEVNVMRRFCLSCQNFVEGAVDVCPLCGGKTINAVRFCKIKKSNTETQESFQRADRLMIELAKLPPVTFEFEDGSELAKKSRE